MTSTVRFLDSKLEVINNIISFHIVDQQFAINVLKPLKNLRAILVGSYQHPMNPHILKIGMIFVIFS